MKTFLCIVLTLLLFPDCSNKNKGKQPGQLPEGASVTTLCIIGTAHDSTALVNPKSIYEAIDCVKPHVILCELEDVYFTPGYEYNLAEYPDLLSANENIAAYRYQQKHNTQLRPYDIEGHSEYYRSKPHFANEQKMFDEIKEAFGSKTLSDESSGEFLNLFEALRLFDFSTNSPLKQLNSDEYIQRSRKKSEIFYNTLVSITERDFPHWANEANLIKNYWNERNKALAENIMTRAKEFEGKRIVVLCGQSQKAALLSNIKLLHGQEHTFALEVKDFWEF